MHMPNTKKLKMEIQDIVCPELFLAYHEDIGGHTILRHVGVSVRELRNRVGAVKKYNKDEIISFSRFSGDISTVLSLIAYCLFNNLGKIEDWIGKDSFLELIHEFPEAIGDAMVMGTDWRNLYSASCIRVILGPSKYKDRLFRIITAYPTFSLDETDLVWDAMDVWQASKNSQVQDRDA